MEEAGYAYKISFVKREGKAWKIKAWIEVIKETGQRGVNCINSAQKRVLWKILVNMLKVVQVPYKAGN